MRDNLLEVGPDPITRQKVAKRLRASMRRLGWTGPWAMRIPGTTGTVQGYWRRPGQLPRPHTVGMPVASELCDDVGLSDDLPSHPRGESILKPVDEKSGPLIGFHAVGGS